MLSFNKYVFISLDQVLYIILSLMVFLKKNNMFSFAIQNVFQKFYSVSIIRTGDVSLNFN